jgi:hypothetical protein
MAPSRDRPLGIYNVFLMLLLLMLLLTCTPAVPNLAFRPPAHARLAHLQVRDGAGWERGCISQGNWEPIDRREALGVALRGHDATLRRLEGGGCGRPEYPECG